MRAEAPNRSILPRAVDSLLTTVLRTMRVVVVAGPRQSGKSTLVRAHPALASRSYFSLDDVGTLLRARTDRRAFLCGHQALTLDEVQRDPDLVPVLKAVVDEQAGHRTGQFVLTGSANLTMMSRISDALSGRAYYLRLQPLTRREQQSRAAAGAWTLFFETPAERWIEALQEQQPETAASWPDAVRRGGLPGAALEISDERLRSAWFEGYVEMYLERDLRELKVVSNLPRFQRLMRAASRRIGGLINHAELAREAQMPQTTVHEHLRLLETTFQVVRLAPFLRACRRRLIKTPKLYWNDVGLALHLGGAEAADPHLENYVLSDLLTWRDTEVPRPEVCYWRTAGGTEVDFVIERKQRLLAIQVRSTTAPTVRDAAHIRTFFEEYGPAACGALVLHAGDETRWLGGRILAVPWWRVL